MTATLLESITSAKGEVVVDDDLYEIIDGQRIGLPAMGIFAIWLANDICHYLNSFARTQNLGWVMSEALFHLPTPIERDRRPDVAFVSYQRWAKSQPIPRTGNAWDVVPNLAVEVVSPTDGAEALTDKVDEYFRAGVDLVWVVFPRRSQIYVYQSPIKITVLGAADVLDGGAVIAGFRLPLADLFTDPAPDGAPSE